MSDLPKHWTLNTEFATKSKFKKFYKKHKAEYSSCFANLSKVKSLLDSGYKLKSFKLGFFRSEGGKLYRVGQSGIVGSKEARLYVYLYEYKQTIYVISIGTKESQQQDIKNAKKMIKEIK